MAEENQAQDTPERVPVVPEVGLSVRVFQGELTGAYGVIKSIEGGGATVVLERGEHEFPALTVDLELN